MTSDATSFYADQLFVEFVHDVMSCVVFFPSHGHWCVVRVARSRHPEVFALLARQRLGALRSLHRHAGRGDRAPGLLHQKVLPLRRECSTNERVLGVLR